MPIDQSRVILHIDLDCFYAQVEHKRLNIPRDVPLAVQQWEGLIAVNYPARARGITRHMRVQDALKQCLELRLVHVETIGDGPRQEEQDIHDTANTTTADSLIAQQEKALSRHQPSNEAPPPAAATSVPSVQQRNDEATQQHYLRQTQKACLERYRRANGDIMSLLHRLAPSAVIEKASIDEVYVDATAMVDAEMRLSDADVAMTDPRACEGGLGSREGQRETGNAGRGRAGVEDAFAWGSIVLGDMPLDPGSEFDRRLATGAGIACRLRAAIRQELGFTSSAGVAPNKLLAKIGSAMHKPDQQTVIPHRAVAKLMQDLPLKKLRGFGGLLGQQLESMGCSTAGQVGALPTETLARTFGHERAKWIASTVKGESDDPVEEKEKPKSLLAAKSFEATSDVSVLQRWLGILAAELAPRMANDEASYKRRPKTLVLHYRQVGSGDRSRQAPMPRVPASGLTPEALTCAAWELFKARCLSHALPCVRLALSVVDFQDSPVHAAAAITRFFKPQNTGVNAAGRTGGHDLPLHGDGASSALSLGPQVVESIETNTERGNERATHAGAKRKPTHAGAKRKPTVEAEKAEVRVGFAHAKRMTGDSLPELRTDIPAQGLGLGIPRGVTAKPAMEPTQEVNGSDVERTCNDQKAWDPLLDGVDIEEQRRLLKEAGMLKALGQKSAGTKLGSGQRPKNSDLGTASGSKQQQKGIARFFKKSS